MSNPHSYSESEKKAVYKAIAERRDMRHFNGQPLSGDVLQKILIAAHMAHRTPESRPGTLKYIENKNFMFLIVNI